MFEVLMFTEERRYFKNTFVFENVEEAKKFACIAIENFKKEDDGNLVVQITYKEILNSKKEEE